MEHGLTFCSWDGLWGFSRPEWGILLQDRWGGSAGILDALVSGKGVLLPASEDLGALRGCCGVFGINEQQDHVLGVAGPVPGRRARRGGR